MDPKTATQLEEVDLLRFKNLQLRKQLLDAEGNDLARGVAEKYQAPDEEMTVNLETGAIARVPTARSP